MITKFNKYLITESPDNIKDEKGYEHWYEHDEARPFFVKVNSNHTKVTDVYIGKNATCHSEMKGFSTIVGKSYPGRIFIYNKLMAFWVYPNEILFDSIIENLEEQLDIQMFNNGWRIEVLKSDDGFIKKEFNPNDKDYYMSNGVGLGKDKILIPIEDYSGSDDVSEEEQIMHLMNCKEKDLAMKAGKFHFGNFGSIKTGWNTPHNIKYRQKIYQENLMLKETPDEIELDGVDYSYENYDAMPFFVEANDDHTKVTKLHVGTYGDAHSDIKNSGNIEEKLYAGRLWKKLKVISFWVYPNDKLFVSIINALEKKLRVKIFNNKWRIEVIKENNKIEKRDPLDDDILFKGDFYVGTRRKFSSDDNFIPIEEYIGSENPSDELRIQHMLNWKEKQKLNINNFGSSKTAWDKPHNLKYRQAIYKENKTNK